MPITGHAYNRAVMLIHHRLQAVGPVPVVIGELGGELLFKGAQSPTSMWTMWTQSALELLEAAAPTFGGMDSPA